MCKVQWRNANRQTLGDNVPPVQIPNWKSRNRTGVSRVARPRNGKVKSTLSELMLKCMLRSANITSRILNHALDTGERSASSPGRSTPAHSNRNSQSVLSVTTMTERPRSLYRIGLMERHIPSYVPTTTYSHHAVWMPINMAVIWNAIELFVTGHAPPPNYLHLFRPASVWPWYAFKCGGWHKKQFVLFCKVWDFLTSIYLSVPWQYQHPLQLLLLDPIISFFII